jgi:glutamate-ammonia-ligase adenylyltransferase
MRLRPSGKQGPLATQIASFRAYQVKEAEIWEHMALTRARPVAGDNTLAGEVSQTIAETLRRPRDRAKLVKAVRDMRALIAKEKGEDDPWNLKLAAGGLLDIEFIAQFMVLAHGAETAFSQAPADILTAAETAGWIDPDSAESLQKTLDLYANVTQWLRLALEPGADPRQAAEGVKRRIATATGLPDFAFLERELAASRKETRRLFNHLLADAARRGGHAPG